MNLRRKVERGLWELRGIVRHRRRLAMMVRTHVYFLEHRGVTVWGGISEEDEAGLRVAVERAAAFEGPIVEIGVLFGWTTQLIASLKRPSQELIAVDNFCWNPFGIPPADHRVITERTLRYCLENCGTRIFDGTAREFYDAYEGPTPSMVFIDADHSYAATRADIEWACAAGVPVVAGHDYMPLHRSVMQAVDDAFGGDVEVFGSVWIADGRREVPGGGRTAGARTAPR